MLLNLNLLRRLLWDAVLKALANEPGKHPVLASSTRVDGGAEYRAAESAVDAVDQHLRELGLSMSGQLSAIG